MAQSQINPSNLDAESLKDWVMYDIQSPINRDYYWTFSAPFPITITQVGVRTHGGTFNLTMKRTRGGSTVALGNLNNIVVTGTAQGIVPSSNNDFTTGDVIWFTISNTTNAILANIEIAFSRNYSQT